MKRFVLIIGLFIVSTSSSDAQTVGANESSVTVYDKEYLSNITNAVTALDLAIKIPGGQVILGRRDNAARGFTSNDDGILINGKRLSGKNNSSEAALGRISISQVNRIEIIRGASPDIKISSQEAMMNIVLEEDKSSSSATFDIGSRILPSGRLFPLGAISYSGSKGRLGYFVEVAQSGFITDYNRIDTVTNSNAITESVLTDRGDQYFHDRSISANATYKLANNDQIHFNASLTNSKSKTDWNGNVINYSPGGIFLSSGRAIQNFVTDTPGFEVSGDYIGNFSPNLDYKIVGLYSKSNAKTIQKRDALITESPLIYDSDTVFFSNAKEAILRPSITYKTTRGSELNLGTEIAYNRVEAGLDPNTLVIVQEIRSDSFINYAWQMNSRLRLDSELKYEYSKISQMSITRDRSEAFSYIKPSVDLRYDINPQNQFQFSIRRTISQLDFNDFAASVDKDNIFFGGNQNLVPEKAWGFETSVEHRFMDDQGHVKLSLKHEEISDHIELVEVAPGIAGVGNVGQASRNVATISTSLRFGFIGLENVVLDGSFELFDTNTADPFTGIDRAFNNQRSYSSTGILRHDMKKYGLSYSFQFWYYGPNKVHSIDQLTDVDHDSLYLSLSINYKIFKNMVLIASVDNLVNANEGRIRTLYNPSRASGMISFIESRDQHFDKRFRIRLKGSF